jgi:hypothetical protein
MSSRGVTRLSRAFCSARDRNVPVLVRAGRTSARTSPRSGDLPHSSADDAELVSCLDYGVRCTGWLCPLFSVPTVPPEELVEEAIQAERNRKARTIAEGRAILERALKEGREWRKQEARRKATRRERTARNVPIDPPPAT